MCVCVCACVQDSGSIVSFLLCQFSTTLNCLFLTQNSTLFSGLYYQTIRVAVSMHVDPVHSGRDLFDSPNCTRLPVDKRRESPVILEMNQGTMVFRPHFVTPLLCSVCKRSANAVRISISKCQTSRTISVCLVSLIF